MGAAAYRDAAVTLLQSNPRSRSSRRIGSGIAAMLAPLAGDKDKDEPKRILVAAKIVTTRLIDNIVA
jgi:pantothenate synthetase